EQLLGANYLGAFAGGLADLPADLLEVLVRIGRTAHLDQPDREFFVANTRHNSIVAHTRRSSKCIRRPRKRCNVTADFVWPGACILPPQSGLEETRKRAGSKLRRGEKKANGNCDDDPAS